MDEENNKLKRNIIYTTGGIIIAGLITWGTIKTVNLDGLKKDKEIAQQEFLQKDKERVESYNILVGKHNNILTSNKAKDETITNLNSKNEVLQNKVYLLDTRTDSIKMDYNATLHTIDSLNWIVECVTNEKNELEILVEKRNVEVSELHGTISKIEIELADCENISSNKSETMNLMQEYLNAYIINRRPLKEKHFDKVYLPVQMENDKILIPFNKEEVKTIRNLNNEYKDLQYK